MRRIQFHNREKEIAEIKRLLNTEPTLITFIYGPINSGKTEFITHVIDKLQEEYIVFYINLRTKFLAGYDDFIESLFEIEIEDTRKKETLKELISSITKFAGIPINREFMDYVFRDKKPKNAFSYIIKIFEEVKSSGKQPVLILDELQKIRDIKINNLLIYELFNFFIDLTKEKHLSHVFVITSDSLFIEYVYSEAMLEGRCRYFLVDDFDKKTTMEFLDQYGFSDKEKELAWNYFGGKLVYLIELINSENKEEKAKELLTFRIGGLETMLKRVKELGGKITIKDRSYAVSYQGLIDTLKRFISNEAIDMSEVDEISKAFLVKENVLFVDPLKKQIKPQSRLELLAIREVMRNV